MITEQEKLDAVRESTSLCHPGSSGLQGAGEEASGRHNWKNARSLKMNEAFICTCQQEVVVCTITSSFSLRYCDSDDTYQKNVNTSWGVTNNVIVKMQRSEPLWYTQRRFLYQLRVIHQVYIPSLSFLVFY